jgi:hypothetical protein
MFYPSPLPDVEILDLPLTAYVLVGAAGKADRPALIDALTPCSRLSLPPTNRIRRSGRLIWCDGAGCDAYR